MPTSVYELRSSDSQTKPEFNSFIFHQSKSNLCSLINLEPYHRHSSLCSNFGITSSVSKRDFYLWFSLFCSYLKWKTKMKQDKKIQIQKAIIVERGICVTWLYVLSPLSLLFGTKIKCQKICVFCVIESYNTLFTVANRLCLQNRVVFLSAKI